jgi:hypothetical protein
MFIILMVVKGSRTLSIPPFSIKIFSIRLSIIALRITAITI